MLPGDADGGGQLAPGQFARDLQPPQRQQLPVLVVQPPHRLGDLAPLALQLEAQHGQLGEVGGRRLLQPLRGPPPGPVPDLPHGDRHQPGPEAVRVAQRAEVVDRAQHGLLDDVVDVGVAVQGPAHDVVDQRQPARDQLVQRLPVAGLRRRDGGAPVLTVHGALSTPGFTDVPHAPSQPVPGSSPCRGSHVRRRWRVCGDNSFCAPGSPGAPDARAAPDGEEPSGAARQCGEGYASSDVITCLIRV